MKKVLGFFGKKSFFVLFVDNQFYLMLECTYSNDQTIDYRVDANVKPESILQNGQKSLNISNTIWQNKRIKVRAYVEQ